MGHGRGGKNEGQDGRGALRAQDRPSPLDTTGQDPCGRREQGTGAHLQCGDHAGQLALGVYHVNGEFYAIEDRCSHDDGPLCEGDWDPEERVVVCPRHGSQFDLRTGDPLTLPAFEPVDTFPVRVEDGIVKVEV